VHAAREVGASAITVSNTAHTDFPKDNLIDDRAATLFKWSAAVTNPWIAIDLGANFDTLLSRLIIPKEHNIPALYIEQADDAAFTTNLEYLHYTSGSPDTSPVAGVQYDSGTFNTQTSDRRHIRVTFVVTTTQIYLPQLVLTKVFAPTVGPVLRNAQDRQRANVTRLLQRTGQSPTVQHGPPQRLIEYEYENPLTGADLTEMEAMIDSVGMTHPLWVDPASWSSPPSTDEPALWMKFEQMPLVRVVSEVPMSGARERVYSLSLIENLD
jgi:hypothetical protein